VRIKSDGKRQAASNGQRFYSNLSSNTAGTDGGGVFSDNLSAFNKTGGTINANNRARRRGNVWLVRGLNRSRTADPSVNAPR